MKQLSLILIGGGDRGSCYLKYLDSNPEKFKLVGIAEPIKSKRDYLKENPEVDSFKAERVEFGGEGITKIKLK